MKTNQSVATTRSQEERIGIYRTGKFDTGVKSRNSLDNLDELYDRFDPKKLQVAPGVYDFTKAHGYDEELTRHNLNHVKRPDTAYVLAPTLVKEVVKKEKPNFVQKNKTGLGEVNAINLKRV